MPFRPPPSCLRPAQRSPVGGKRPFRSQCKRTATTVSSASSHAQKFASRVLEEHREIVRKEIATLEKADPKDKEVQARLLAKKVDLGYSDPKNHEAFVAGKGAPTQDVFAAMHQQRWKSKLVPRLRKSEENWKIIGDVLPKSTTPTVIVQMNFQNTEWLAPIGQPVPPIWTLYSPEVTITTNDDAVRHFTVALVDVDRPDSDTKSYEEWCHWLITDVPVQRRLVIPGGSSPYLQTPKDDAAKGELEKMLTGAHFVPKAPETAPVIPGNVVFPYVPAHPPASNPRKQHRYMLVVLEQEKEGSVKIDVESLKAQARKTEAELKKKAEEAGLPQWERSALGEREAEIMVRERGLLLPITKFIKDNNLTLKGRGFMTSFWDIHTPAVFSQLGIHEPVYGSLHFQSPRDTVASIQTATDLASSLPGPIAALSAATLKALNYGRPESLSPARLLTRRGTTVDNMRRADAEAILQKRERDAANAKVGGKGAKNAKVAAAAADVASPKAAGKRTIPRVTVLAAAAMVRNRTGDIAKGSGEMVRSVKEKRYRYKNV
ncbi:uncharacterized protein EV422DRAFT_519929 [Fimicolochytrium jonesii]|uniref:uncharacterized protein n=1 Tax=Fimicolochytrium jonesii TaxID=1396493 RepID=UPI0022FF33F4|nr:uncharacterized protein EV422DRAFT_519929 [Fimicolochytrium jonesii]KAI8824383.1 hypothetical protein EV422DRAFT_519929 [Fimicolochytrium jonesii]